MEKKQKMRVNSRLNESDLLHTPGGRVTKVRMIAGLTQAEFAASIEIGDKHLGYIERGDRKLTRDIAHRIAEKYHERESWLLCETDYRTEDEERAAQSLLDEERFNNLIEKNNRRHSLMIELVQIHGYNIVEHEPRPNEIKTDEDGNKYYDVYYEIVSPSGARRIISSEAMHKFLLSLDFLIEGQLLFMTQRLEGTFLYG